MQNLSYSFHLSTKNHAVTTTGRVEQESRNNLRLYSKSQFKSKHYDRNMIDILRGSKTSVLDDIKRIYHEEFDEARENYNKGKRSDRVIKDYLKHVSDSRTDVACQIIIQIGDREFWEELRKNGGWNNAKIKDLMSPIFESQLTYLEELVPELKIASAVVHYDESSPHMHIIGVPVAKGYKKGMSKQVAKTKVFTPERLSSLQDRMRENANDLTDDTLRYDGFGKFELGDETLRNISPFYGCGIDPKAKRKGRNKDIPKESLDEYYKLKREIEVLKGKKEKLETDIQDLEKQEQNKREQLDTLSKQIEEKASVIKKERK